MRDSVVTVATALTGYLAAMDQSEAPLLDALIDYHRNNRYGFTPPGHRQVRGAVDLGEISGRRLPQCPFGYKLRTVCAAFRVMIAARRGRKAGR